MGSLLLFQSEGRRRRLPSIAQQLIGLLIFTLSLLSTACGVKGDPLPPETPPYIGSGEPNFKGGISVQPEEEPEEELEEESEE